MVKLYQTFFSVVQKMDLLSYIPTFANGEVFVTRYKSLISLAVDLILYSGRCSLLGTR